MTLRSIYRRWMTLFGHRCIAAETLGFRALPEHAARKLTAHLQCQAAVPLDRGDSVRDVPTLLYDHRRYVLPGAIGCDQCVSVVWYRSIPSIPTTLNA